MTLVQGRTPARPISTEGRSVARVCGVWARMRAAEDAASSRPARPGGSRLHSETGSSEERALEGRSPPGKEPRSLTLRHRRLVPRLDPPKRRELVQPGPHTRGKSGECGANEEEDGDGSDGAEEDPESGTGDDEEPET
jgi:hypothetical protein